MIRNAIRDDLDWMLDWAAREGWNPGLEDADAFYQADPEGFFVSLADGRPVACISVVNHTPEFAFLGFYICDPAWRGRGIGLRLWQAALEHAGARTVGLDGVADQQENYARSGFVRAGSTTRLGGVLPKDLQASECRAVRASDAPALRALDRAATDLDRESFISAWTADTATRRTVLLPDQSGFATARACREGIKIGPVVAPDPETAFGLIVAAAQDFNETPAFVDVPDGQMALRARLEGVGLASVFETARMYRGTAPEGNDTLRAVATLELG